jgi:hypothetical protein
MADHEIDLRSGLLDYELRCICEPGMVLGTYFLESSAKDHFKKHLKAKDVKPPVNHEIVLHGKLLSSGTTCGCACGTDLGGFSSEASAILAWRKHSGK